MAAGSESWELHLNHERKTKKTAGSDERPLISKPTTRDALPPTRLHHPNLPKQHHLLMIGCSNSWDYEGHSHLNYHSLHLGFMHSVTLRKLSLVLSSTWVWRGKLGTILKCQASKMNTSFLISSGWLRMLSVYWRLPCFFLLYFILHVVCKHVYATATVFTMLFFPDSGSRGEHHQLCSFAVHLLDFQGSLFHCHFPFTCHLYDNVLGSP